MRRGCHPLTERLPSRRPSSSGATWLRETDAPLTEVKALLQTFEDGGNWAMTEQTPRRSPRPRKPNPQQDLFKH